MRILILTIFIILLTSFKPINDNQIIFPKRVGLFQLCKGKEVEFDVEIMTASKEDVMVHSFFLENQNFVILKDSNNLLISDTMYLSYKKPLTFKVKFKPMTSKKPSFFSFKSNLPNYIDNKIEIGYGELYIRINDLINNKDCVLNFSDNCEDSIRIYFPESGTTSNVTVFNYSDSTKKEFKSISYGRGGTDNFVTMDKNNIGVYYMKYNSCFWEKGIWLKIK